MSKLYVKCTTDKYELPLAVADSTKELARMVGKSARSIATMISKGYPGYHSVECEPEWYPTNDGGLWRWDEQGRVITID